MSAVSRQEIIAWHEAGHAVVAYRLGIPLARVTMQAADDQGGWKGEALAADARESISPALDALVCLAGAEAARQYSPAADQVSEHASDYASASTLALKLHGGNEEAARSYLRWLGGVARDSVEAWRSDIDRVARALHAWRSLSGKEVQRLLTRSGAGQSEGPGEIVVGDSNVGRENEMVNTFTRRAAGGRDARFETGGLPRGMRNQGIDQGGGEGGYDPDADAEGAAPRAPMKPIQKVRAYLLSVLTPQQMQTLEAMIGEVEQDDEPPPDTSLQAGGTEDRGRDAASGYGPTDRGQGNPSGFDRQRGGLPRPGGTLAGDSATREIEAFLGYRLPGTSGFAVPVRAETRDAGRMAYDSESGYRGTTAGMEDIFGPEFIDRLNSIKVVGR